MKRSIEEKKRIECNAYGVCTTNNEPSIIQLLQQVSEFGLKILSSTK